MSKKRNHNRPKKHSDHRSREQQAPKKTTEEQLASESRRKFLKLAGETAVVGGAAFLGMRFLLNRFFKGNSEDGDKSQNSERETYDLPAIKNPALKNPEWMKGIELPRSTVEQAPLDWTQKEKDEYFLPKGLNPEEVRAFYREYEALKKALLSDMARLKDKKERGDRISEFISKLSGNYIKYTGLQLPLKMTYGSYEYASAIQKINNSLIPQGELFMTSFDFNKGVGLTFFAPEMRMAHIVFGGKKISIPALYLSRKDEIESDHSKGPLDMNAFYSQEGKYLGIDEKGMRIQAERAYDEFLDRAGKLGIKPKEIDRDEFIRDSGRLAFTHECAHAALETQGVDPTGNNGMKRKGAVSMGNYTLPEDLYFRPDNIQLHELVAIGTGLANAGKSVAHYTYGFDARKSRSYHLALVVILHEIFNSPYVAKEIRDRMKSDLFERQTVVVDTRMKAVTQIPMEELRKIGERMAKLGIYLAQDK